MALHTGLRHPERLAGIIALSGYLPLADTLGVQRSEANLATPIFMAHGNQDPVVALDRAVASHQQLTRQGYQVQWHTYDMEHSVHPREVADIARFLRGVLGRAGAASTT
jgi:phospholipase/carboxylesterase